MEQLNNIFFIDIETVPVVPDFNLLTPGLQEGWVKKSKFLRGNLGEIPEPSTAFIEKSGVYSEFAKVVCIGFGSLNHSIDGWKIRLKSIVNEDEKELLKDFCEVVSRFTAYHSDIRFCGHNIKEFDIPFICRRMLINGLGLPACLQLSGKKPWEISHLDTLELWRFGDYKHYTSLALLAEVLGIPSPKDDIDGSMVGEVFWKDKDLARIGEYCLKDVLTSAKVFLKLKGHNEIDIEPVYVTD